MKIIACPKGRVRFTRCHSLADFCAGKSGVTLSVGIKPDGSVTIIAARSDDALDIIVRTRQAPERTRIRVDKQVVSGADRSVSFPDSCLNRPAGTYRLGKEDL